MIRNLYHPGAGMERKQLAPCGLTIIPLKPYSDCVTVHRFQWRCDMHGMTQRLGLATAGITLLLLAACTSVGDMRTAGPVATFSSNQEPLAAATCVRDAWGEVSIGGSRWQYVIEPRSDGYSVSTSSSGVPAEFVEITPRTGGGSEIKFYSRFLQRRQARYIEAATHCGIRSK